MPSRRFKIEFAPTAWTQVGALTSEEFRALQAALANLAESYSKPPKNLLVEAAGAVQVGRFAARYQLDQATDTLVLVNISREAPPTAK